MPQMHSSMSMPCPASPHDPDQASTGSTTAGHHRTVACLCRYRERVRLLHTPLSRLQHQVSAGSMPPGFPALTKAEVGSITSSGAKSPPDPCLRASLTYAEAKIGGIIVAPAPPNYPLAEVLCRHHLLPSDQSWPKLLAFACFPTIRTRMHRSRPRPPSDHLRVRSILLRSKPRARFDALSPFDGRSNPSLPLTFAPTLSPSDGCSDPLSRPNPHSDPLSRHLCPSGRGVSSVPSLAEAPFGKSSMSERLPTICARARLLRPNPYSDPISFHCSPPKLASSPL